MGVSLIGGKVTIDPDHTTIELDLDFQTLDQSTLKNGKGKVTIDTRGLFQLQASGLIVGVLDANLLLQVAWNPLDVLLQADVSCCSALIKGQLRLHAWLGQGWQNKYDWLPDDDTFHFTGSIKASLSIPEGYVADVGPVKLPPFDFVIEVKIAFGEFCKNCRAASMPGACRPFSILRFKTSAFMPTKTGSPSSWAPIARVGRRKLQPASRRVPIPAAMRRHDATGDDLRSPRRRERDQCQAGCMAALPEAVDQEPDGGTWPDVARQRRLHWPCHQHAHLSIHCVNTVVGRALFSPLGHQKGGSAYH